MQKENIAKTIYQFTLMYYYLLFILIYYYHFILTLFS